MKNLVIQLGIFLIIGSCGVKKKSDPVDVIFLKDGESLSVHTKKLSIDPKTPQGLGTLISLRAGLYNQNEAGLCTWFLVGPNRAMTNSHCIPDVLKATNTLNCGEYLQGVIQTRNGQKITRCKKLIYYSEFKHEVARSNDYALVELDTSFADLETLTLDRSGAVENQRINILTMTHHLSIDGTYSEFKKQTCIIKSSDSLARISTPGSSPMIGFQEEGSGDFCKTVGGNSGSPVIESSGRLIGILHGGVKEGASMSEKLSAFQNNITSNLSVFTNLRCQKFNDLEMDQAYPAECALELVGQNTGDTVVPKEASAKYIKALDDASNSLPTFLEYDSTSSTAAGVSKVNFIPRCMKPFAEWDAATTAKIVKESRISRKKSIVVSVPQFKYFSFLSWDYYGNKKIDYSFIIYGQIEVLIQRLERFEAKKSAPMTVDLSLLGDYRRVTRTIPMCETLTSEEAFEE